MNINNETEQQLLDRETQLVNRITLLEGEAKRLNDLCKQLTADINDNISKKEATRIEMENMDQNKNKALGELNTTSSDLQKAKTELADTLKKIQTETIELEKKNSESSITMRQTLELKERVIIDRDAVANDRNALHKERAEHAEKMERFAQFIKDNQ